MKIEMCESLFYSWLRHVKECRVVQTNWKVSPKWEMKHEEEVYEVMEKVQAYYLQKCGYQIFKKNSSMAQVIQQAECDVIGISVENGKTSFYAVDVAFHESGVNYGPRKETVMKIIAKCVRNAMCLYGYMDTKDAEVIFASPKINPAIMRDLLPCINELNTLLCQCGYKFRVRVIANEDFDEQVLQPILVVSEGVADTAELFLRSYQMYQMFAQSEKSSCAGSKRCSNGQKRYEAERKIYNELKIGKLVQTVMKPLIIQNTSADEIEQMQEAEYSKRTFGIQYPLLLQTKAEKAEKHYYKELFTIGGNTYRLCCEWFEQEENNDRPFVEKWIEEHMDKEKKNG